MMNKVIGDVLEGVHGMSTGLFRPLFYQATWMR